VPPSCALLGGFAISECVSLLQQHSAEREMLASAFGSTPLVKKTANLFLSELHRISTNFDNFWQKDGKEAKIMQGALIFHLT